MARAKFLGEQGRKPYEGDEHETDLNFHSVHPVQHRSCRSLYSYICNASGYLLPDMWLSEQFNQILLQTAIEQRDKWKEMLKGQPVYDEENIHVGPEDECITSEKVWHSRG